MNVNRELLAFLRKQYPVGTRIRLDSMQDPYAPVEAGTTGKLDYIDDAGQFHMKWDNGRTLALIPGVDSFTVLPPELSMTKLYMPLTAELYEPDVYGNMQEEPELLTGHDLTAYEDHIRSALVKYRMPEEVNRGIMHWYDTPDSVNDKVRSVTFNVERRNGKLWGIAECQISGELSAAELTTLKKYIEGQASDGWGEGFEQHEIAVGRGSELYVHLWQDHGWSIQTEQERFCAYFEKLPEMCFTLLPGTGQLICIKRGESGYYPSDWSTGDAHENRRIADEQNRKRGVPPAQEEAMKIGSMCGWDVPGADPDNCEDIVQRRGGWSLDKKIISIYMGNPDNSNHAELELPATPREMVDAMDRLRLSEGQEPYWQVEDMGRYEFLAPHLDGYDLYQFNALAEKLRTFSDVDAVAFEGLVQMELNNLYQNNGGELTLRRVLDLAYSVDCCHVVPGITDDAALGQFYVENDFLPDLATVPDSVLEMLDYEKIGRSMREGEGGVLTPHGYVMQESERRQAPSNLGRPPRKPPYMIYFLCVSDVRAVKLYLPAKQVELDAVLDCLEVDSWQEVRLEECDAAMPEMWLFTDMAYDGMEQINRFAQCLEELDRNNELIKFKAVAGQLDIRSLDDALALAEHLSEYALEPGLHSLEELAREELSVIASDPDRDLLTRHLNMEAYGAALLWRDKGVFSDYGYICRPDGQPLQVPRQGVDMTMQ